MIDATKLGRAQSAPVVGGTGPQRLNLKRNYPFNLGHYPTEWEIVETKKGDAEDGSDSEYTWLPRLKKLQWVPGVNGVRKRGKQIDPSIARADYQARGFTIIDTHAVELEGPHGLPRGGYVMEYPGRGGTVYLCRWEVPKMLAGRVLIKTDEDPDAMACYNAFRIALVEQGIIAAPDPDALALIVDGFHVRAKRHAKNAHIPSVKAKLDEVARNIDLAATATQPQRGGRDAVRA